VEASTYGLSVDGCLHRFDLTLIYIEASVRKFGQVIIVWTVPPAIKGEVPERSKISVMRAEATIVRRIRGKLVVHEASMLLADMTRGRFYAEVKD
jgi:hypothetical protein